jgi:hypothetical protein
MNTNVRLTFNTKEFEKLGTPCTNHKISAYLSIPISLEYNKTYYRFDAKTNNLQAFRILAMALRGSFYRFFIQYPNQEPTWEAMSLSGIYESKESFLNSAFGNGCEVEFQYKRLDEILPQYRYFDYICAKTWEWSVSSSCPKISNSAPIVYFFIDSNGFHIGIDNTNGKFFLTKEECAKSKLESFTISEFAEEPIEIKILPNECKKRVIKIIEF